MSISAAFVRLLAVILTSSLLLPTLGDEFTNPSNSNPDLTAHYTLGQTVEISWDTSLQYITLSVSHWGQGYVIGALLSDQPNPGSFSWTIGESDNINEEEIAADQDFVLEIQDPSGQIGTGNGFINNSLQSRGFIITSNVLSSSSSSSFVHTTSTSVSSVSSTSLSSSTTTPAFVPTGTSSPIPAFGLSIGAKAGIGVGAGTGGLALLAVGVFIGVFLSAPPRQERQATSRTLASYAVPRKRDCELLYIASRHDTNPSIRRDEVLCSTYLQSTKRTWR